MKWRARGGGRTMWSMVQLDESTPVGQIARFYPAAIAVFEEFDIDYACKGGRCAADAARASGFTPEALMQALYAVTNGGKAAEPSISELIHTIVSEHHRFEGPRLRELASRLDKFAANGEVLRMQTILRELTSATSVHMAREERNLFPQIEELDIHPHRVRAGSISRPLLNEFVEHDTIHERVEKLRELALRVRTRGVDGEVLDAIEEFYLSVHRHMHLENNVLIPRVIDLENRLKSERRVEATV